MKRPLTPDEEAVTHAEQLRHWCNERMSKDRMQACKGCFMSPFCFGDVHFLSDLSLPYDEPTTYVNGGFIPDDGFIPGP